jgi:iron complex outermembrane receptor protein
MLGNANSRSIAGGTAAVILGSIASAPAAAEPVLIEEVVVTATRRATELGSTPLSVSVMTEAALHDAAAYDIMDWFSAVPGLNYSDDGWGGHRTTIRGITSGTVTEPRPLSAWYVDDTPTVTISGTAQLGQVGAPHPQAIDLARIEVLRGPQGTLFGSNAIGGAVRFVTNPPDLSQFYSSIEADLSTTEHGSDNATISGILNVPVAKQRAALRVVAFQRDEGGYIDNVTRGIRDIDNVRTTGGRASARWQPAPALEVRFTAFAQKRDSDGLSEADPPVGPYDQARAMPEQDVETWELYSLVLDYDLSWAQLTSITSYVDRQPVLTFDITSFTELALGFTTPASTRFKDGVRDTVQEFRLASKGQGRLSLLGGIYYQAQHRAVHQDWIVPGYDEVTGGAAASFGYPDNPYHADSLASLTQRAVFGEVGLAVTPAWQLTLGLRWFRFMEDVDYYWNGLFVGGPDEFHGSYDEDGVTPKVQLSYNPNERTLVYLNAAEGFRPGGTNELTGALLEACEPDLQALGIGLPPNFESDSLWSYELGARTRWLEDRLSAHAAVFHIDWSDMQTVRLLPTCGASYAENNGRARSDGAELELTWVPIDPLQLKVAASYVDARLVEVVANVQGEKDQAIPTVPRWTVDASARGEFDWLTGLIGYVQGDYRYVSEAWNVYDKSVRTLVPSRDILDLRLGAQGKVWQVEAYVDNLFDERAVVFHNLNFLGEWQTLERPRTVGLRARLEF